MGRFIPSNLNFVTACDPAGPEFYYYDSVTTLREAAINVQCLHTSADFGTLARDCDQSIILGQPMKDCRVNF